MNRLKEIREAKGMRQVELAYLADVSVSQISNIERGEVKQPSLELLKKLAGPLDCSPADICPELAAMARKQLVEWFQKPKLDFHKKTSSKNF